MSANTLPNYPPFDAKDSASTASEWEDWIEGLECLLAAMKVTEKTEKFDKLFHYLGPSRKVLKKDNGIATKDFPLAKTALDKHFAPQRNSIYLLNQLFHWTIFTCE